MKQLKQFKVGQEVITKFPVEINLSKYDGILEVVITEYLRPCGWNGCLTCGDKFIWTPKISYIDKKRLKNLSLVPRISNGNLNYHLKLKVTHIAKGSGQFQNLRFAESLVDSRGNILEYNHFAFLKI